MSSLFADTHNMVVILAKSDAAEGFEQIIDFLSGSYIHYALTMNPHIYVSKKIVISEDVIHEILQLDDGEGLVCLPNEEIFAGLAQMGYEKPSTKLTFYKAFFSSHWKFLIHILLQSLSAKRTSWNEFSLAMASAVICLSTEEGIAKEQVQADDAVAAAVQETVAEDVGTSQQIESSDDMNDVFNQGRMIDDLDKDEGIELVVDQVKDADTAKTEGRHAAEQAEKQAEIYQLDLDHPSKVLKVVTAATSQVSAASVTISAAKPSIPTAALIVVAAYTRRRKGVIIRDPKEELSSKTYAKTPKLKDKGKARFGANMRFLLKSIDEMEEEDREVLKSINETPTQKAAKRRKLNDEAQEVKDLKKHLEVVNDEDDDVFTEATPIARKPLELMLSKRSKKNTKCVNAADEELTADKHKLMLLVYCCQKDNTTAEELMLPSES
nr:hypothetical protein [Tanacetum cinerariifolium]